MDDLISRQAAIDAIRVSASKYTGFMGMEMYTDDDAVEAINGVPSAQPEQSLDIQDILDYLDTVLHPILSSDHWNVYSELYDMISDLPSAQPERKKGKWIDRAHYCVCNLCGHTEQQFNGVEPIPMHTPFCAACGADMRGNDNE